VADAGSVPPKDGRKRAPISNGDHALRLAERHAGRVDLVLTDVVMAGMNGRELVERLEVRIPHLKALYMSGYTDDVILRAGVVNAAVTLLEKPFAPLTLCQTVRSVLDQA
jgi:two-component system cell cycle sensor histidine kinase/response regulator CckA